MSVPTLEQEHPVLTAQHWIDQAIDQWKGGGSEATVQLCGLAVPLDHAFDGLGTLIARFASSAADLSIAAAHTLASGRRIAVGLDYTIDPDATAIERMADFDSRTALFGIATTAALDVLLCNTLERAADTLERFDDLRTLAGVAHLPNDRALRLAGIDHDEEGRSGSTLLNAITLTQRAPSMNPSDRLSFRIMNAVPRYPHPAHKRTTFTPLPAQSSPWPNSPGTAGNLPARYIPQSMWASVMDVLPRPGTKNTGAHERAMSMALARTGTFQRWVTIALHLQLPARSATSIQRVFTSLHDQDLLEETLYVLDKVADALLRTPPPIDYARRRWVFRDLDSVGKRFRKACQGQGIAATDRRRRFCGMYLWEILTGGDCRMRPEPQAPRSPADRTAFAAFKLSEGKLLSEFMHREAERHLLRHRIDEPVQWQPVFDLDEDTWSSPEPDLRRQLSGWTTQSRLDTLRKNARDHTPQLWSALVDDLRLEIEDIAQVIRVYSDRYRSSAMGISYVGDLIEPGGDLSQRPVCWLTLEASKFERGVREFLDLPTVLFDLSDDGSAALTESGECYLQQLEHTYPEALTYGKLFKNESLWNDVAMLDQPQRTEPAKMRDQTADQVACDYETSVARKDESA